MKVKFIVQEDFINYKNPSMFIGTTSCTFKCGCDCCQNSELATAPVLDIKDNRIVELYMNNSITNAIVFGGLEPFDTFDELLSLIDLFRKVTDDDIVIYSGYYSFEILDKLKKLCKYKNIVIKYGRFIPNQKSHLDKTLGVELSSPNQFAVKLTDDEEVIDALIANNGYCPCALELSNDTKCCCREFREGLDLECPCGLYTKLI